MSPSRIKNFFLQYFNIPHLFCCFYFDCHFLTMSSIGNLLGIENCFWRPSLKNSCASYIAFAIGILSLFFSKKKPSVPFSLPLLLIFDEGIKREAREFAGMIDRHQDPHHPSASRPPAKSPMERVKRAPAPRVVSFSFFQRQKCASEFCLLKTLETYGNVTRDEVEDGTGRLSQVAEKKRRLFCLWKWRVETSCCFIKDEPSFPVGLL